MQKHRLSISILLSLIAALMAFYSGFVFSQVKSAGLARSGHASLAVSVRVLDTCRIQTSDLALPATLRDNQTLAAFGARCSLTEPVLASGFLLRGSDGAAVSPASRATVDTGATSVTAGGTPYWAEALDNRMFVTF